MTRAKQMLLAVLLALAGLPAMAAAEAAHPNVVFIEVDDLTFKYLGAFGNRVIQTPAIDALARRGVLFRNAIVQGCMCAPSRNSLITARYPQNLGLYSNGDVRQLPEDAWAFPSSLRAAGMHTAWIGKSHLLPFIDDQRGRNGDRKTAGMRSRMGFDEVWQSAGRHVAMKKARELAADPVGQWKRGVDAYADHLHDRGLLARFLKDGVRPTTLAVDDYLDGFIAKRSADWIADYDGSKPFFLWVNFSGPHAPYNPPARYLTLYEANAMPPIIHDAEDALVPAVLRPHELVKSADAISLQRAQYAGMITFMDEQVARVVGAIDRKGIADDTVIVFFSDHGIMEGDHGLIHKETLYKEVLNACLIVVDPRGRKGAEVDRPVELLDLATTTLDYAGCGEDARGKAFGESLIPLIRGDESSYHRTTAVAQIRDATAMVTARWKYIETPERPVLFDLRNDPDERIDVAETHADVCDEFRSRLQAWRRDHGPVIAAPDRGRDAPAADD